MSGRALNHGGSKRKADDNYRRLIRNESSAYHYCPCCTQAFKFDADYKAHYKITHARPK